MWPQLCMLNCQHIQTFHIIRVGLTALNFDNILLDKFIIQNPQNNTRPPATFMKDLRMRRWRKSVLRVHANDGPCWSNILNI
uniref:Uncharacterized protein n=1 Tax=Arundo donax TaxID=35708 RepID=A0A0A9DLF0_ARUDO